MQNSLKSSSVADPDPRSGAFLIPGSGSRDKYPGSYFSELGMVFGLKILKFLSIYCCKSGAFLTPGSGIEMEKKGNLG
jgi:hypothetical protein